MKHKIRFVIYIIVCFIPFLLLNATIQIVGWIVTKIVEHYLDMEAAWNNVYKSKL